MLPENALEKDGEDAIVAALSAVKPFFFPGFPRHGGRMHVLAINGSPQRSGNTGAPAGTRLKPLANAGIETEILHLADHPVSPCRGCRACGRNKNGLCAIANDELNTIFARMRAADGIVLGFAVYFSMSHGNAALLHRTGMVSRVNGDLCAQGGGRSGGGAPRRRIHAFDTLNHFFPSARWSWWARCTGTWESAVFPAT